MTRNKSAIVARNISGLVCGNQCRVLQRNLTLHELMEHLESTGRGTARPQVVDLVWVGAQIV